MRFWSGRDRSHLKAAREQLSVAFFLFLELDSVKTLMQFKDVDYFKENMVALRTFFLTY